VVSGYTDWHHTDRRPPLPVGELGADRDSVVARWRQRSQGG
jgi:hypothetical protein